MTLQQKQVAVVTGASGGIGFEICKQLAKKDVHVILTGRNREKGQAASKKLQGEGLDIEFCELDVASEKSIKEFSGFLKEKYGRVSYERVVSGNAMADLYEFEIATGEHSESNALSKSS